MTGAFVGVAQALGIEQALIVEHDGVLEGGTQRVAGAAEARDVIEEAEGAGAADLAAEPLRAELERVALLADDGIDEVDLDLGAEAAGIGPELAEGIADHDGDRLQDLQETADRGLGHDSGLINRGDEGSRAAVHDRNFGTVDFDGGVVHTHTAQGGKNVLSGGNQRAFAVAQHGGKFGCDDRLDGRYNLAVGALKAGTDKNKTCIDWCRSNGEMNG